eukprot:jgi/Picre1/28638/NNA_004038.t1
MKGIIMLLLKTAATGALATVLDALIEIRRRHMYLVSLREEIGADAMGGEEAGVVSSPSGYLGIGNLTRAGISAWRSRLLIGIDELEKQALRYGIQPSHRFSPNESLEDVVPEKKRILRERMMLMNAMWCTHEANIDNSQAAYPSRGGTRSDKA